MNDATGVRRLRHHGDCYGGSATKSRNGKKGAVVPKGTVVVRSTDSAPARHAVLSRVPKKLKEEGNNPSFISWEERYDPPRVAVFYKADVTEALHTVRKRSPDFRLHLAEQFAAAIREYFGRHGVSQCPGEVLARGCYPTNGSAGEFYQAKVGTGTFTVPAKFFQNIPLRARPRLAVETTTMRRKPKKVSQKK